MPERDYAMQLNADAGRHLVTTDPRELAAASEATRRSYEEFPYYEKRFGDRGRAFGTSDGAWIVSICDMHPDEARAQIRWLGSMLSARGMPQLLVERHLELLHEELIARVPERRRHYNVLSKAAATLARARRTRMPRGPDIARDFDAAAPNLVPRFGELIVSSVADEAAGIENAVASLEGWATDSTRFPPEWIRAVRDAIAAARSHVRKS